MVESTGVGDSTGELACVPFGCGVMEDMFMFGRDMPNPGPMLDQCRMFANLFMLKRESRERGE